MDKKGKKAWPVQKTTKDRSDLDPYEINFLPDFWENRGSREPFINEYGVVIGDHMYESAHSPLQQWDEDTDPAIMAGDQWVHPFKDIGFHSEENRAYFEEGTPLRGGTFMHASQDVAFEINRSTPEDEPGMHTGEGDVQADDPKG